MIYANHAGTSWPKPARVSEAVAAALEVGPAGADAIVADARASVCESFGIDSPERFLFAPGCTAALAVAVADLPWRTGDRVLSSSLEHHALVRPLQALAVRGVSHDRIPYRPGVPFDLDAARVELRRGDVRLVAVSGASNVTGELLPVAEIARLAHEHGALCLLDAAQLAGVVPVDVRGLGVDLFAFAGHKGPLGPQGIGGLWAAPHVAFATPRAACAIDGSAEACVPFPGYCDLGAVNVAAAAGLRAGLEARAGMADGDRSRTLARELARWIDDCPGCMLFGAVDAERTATVSMSIDGLPIGRAEAAFAEHGIVVRAGEHCAADALGAIGAPAGTIRVSFGPQSSPDDREAVERAIDALRRGTD